METLFRDLQYAVRMLIKNRLVTTIAVLALALGIGANSAIFSVVNAVLLRSLPYKAPDRLVIIGETEAPDDKEIASVAYLNYVDWKEQNQVFEDIAVFRSGDFIVSGGEESERLSGAIASSSLFPTLGAIPALGRTFLPEEDKPGGGQVVIPLQTPAGKAPVNYRAITPEYFRAMGIPLLRGRRTGAGCGYSSTCPRARLQRSTRWRRSDTNDDREQRLKVEDFRSVTASENATGMK